MRKTHCSPEPLPFNAWPRSVKLPDIGSKESTMRWKDLRRSENVRDVRGEEGGGGGMRAGMPISLGRGGLLGTVAVLVVVYLIGGPDALQTLLDGGGGGSAPTAEQGSPLTAND